MKYDLRQSVIHYDWIDVCRSFDEDFWKHFLSRNHRDEAAAARDYDQLFRKVFSHIDGTIDLERVLDFHRYLVKKLKYPNPLVKAELDEPCKKILRESGISLDE